MQNTATFPRTDMKALLSAPLLMTGLCAALFLGLPPVASLLLGAGLVWLVGNPAAGLSAAMAGRGLAASVVLLGFGLNFGEAVHTGVRHALPGLLSVAAILGLGLWIGRLFGLERVLALLLAGGTAICGGSAVAALSPALRAGPARTATALAVIFLLNGLALLLFPLASALAGLGAEAHGLWCALAIHDTSSVLGAAAAHSPEALAVALPVKLTRALWIIPLCLCAPLLLRGGRGRAPLPWFLAGVLGASLLATLAPAQAALWQGLARGGEALLAGSLFLTGCALTPANLVAAGWRPLAAAGTLWLASSTLLLFVAKALHP